MRGQLREDLALSMHGYEGRERRRGAGQSSGPGANMGKILLHLQLVRRLQDSSWPQVE